METPTLQALSKAGVTFDAAMAVAPLTLVAHSSILTGLYPPQHGVRNNGTHQLGEGITTLAERLKAKGYATGAFVSAAVLERRYGLAQGFDVYDDDLSTGRSRHPRMVPDRPAQATVRAALSFLDSLPVDKPFFLWVHLYDPHAAYAPPSPFREKYRSSLYDGEIAYMDAQVGTLLDHVRLSARSNAVVVALGDHGESLGEHGEATHGILAYESTLRIPLLLRYPGCPSGERVSSPVSQIDVVPTLLSLLDLPLEPALPGIDLVSSIRHPSALTARTLYAESYLPHFTYGWARLKVARRGPYKLIDSPSPELYDLKRDPLELTSVNGTQEDLQRDLKQALDLLLASLGNPENEAPMVLTDDMREALAALGYLAVGTGKGIDAKREIPPREGIRLHVMLEQAHRFEADGLFSLAEKKLLEVLQRDERNLAAWLDLASVRAADGRVKEAQQAAETALGLDPAYAQTHIVLARLKARQGRVREALLEVQALCRSDPTLVQASLLEVSLLRELGAIEDAKARTKELLARYPQDARVLLSAAQTLELSEGDLTGAEVRLRAALSRDPFLTPAWQLLGTVLEQARRFDEAIAAYKSGLERAPDAAALHASLGLLLARVGESMAPYHLKEAIRLSPEPRPELKVALSSFFADHGQPQEAQRLLEEVLKTDPQHPGARNNQAIAYYRSGDVAQAERILTELLQDNPRNVDAHNNLAAVAVEKEDWKTAERQAREALELNPHAVEAWNNLGIACEEQGRVTEGLSAYEKALEADALYYPARLNFAIALSKAGRATEAQNELEAVLGQVPQHAETHYQLAALLSGPLKDPEKARRHYNAFLRYAPNDPRAAEVRVWLQSHQGE